jgi:hypothetical protein
VGRVRRPASGAVPGAQLIFRRARFGELIARQLDLFERENAGDLAEVTQLLDRYHAAGRDEAEERYGDYQDALQAVADLLEEMRDAYARTLDGPEADQYERELGRAVRQRFPDVELTS